MDCTDFPPPPLQRMLSGMQRMQRIAAVRLPRHLTTGFRLMHWLFERMERGPSGNETAMTSLQGKIALVTGASSGIGRAAALRLARQRRAGSCWRARTVAAHGYRSPARFRAAGGDALAVKTDVTRRRPVPPRRRNRRPRGSVNSTCWSVARACRCAPSRRVRPRGAGTRAARQLSSARSTRRITRSPRSSRRAGRWWRSAASPASAASRLTRCTARASSPCRGCTRACASNWRRTAFTSACSAGEFVDTSDARDWRGSFGADRQTDDRGTGGEFSSVACGKIAVGRADGLIVRRKRQATLPWCRRAVVGDRRT